MTAARDAHLVRRLVIGHDVSDEIELVSEPLRSLADRLARLPLQDRSNTDRKNYLRSARYGAAQMDRTFSGSRQALHQASVAASKRAS